MPFLHVLIRGLAKYEREPHSAQLTEPDLLRDGFGPSSAYTCLITEYNGIGCGFALYFPIYSTWTGRAFYLEDLFVQPEYRGRGIGKALLSRVVEAAVKTGCVRLDWSVLRWNEPAIGFYKQLGAYQRLEWERMRLKGEALVQIADHGKQPVSTRSEVEA